MIMNIHSYKFIIIIMSYLYNSHGYNAKSNIPISQTTKGHGLTLRSIVHYLYLIQSYHIAENLI